MNKLLLFLITLSTYVNLFAQEPELLNNTWYLQNLTIDDTDIFRPSNNEVQNVSATFEATGEMNHFFSTVCESLDGTMTFDDPNSQFSYIELNQTLGEGCTDSDNADFEATYFQFYFNNAEDPFTYEIVNSEGDEMQLIITGDNGNQAFYSNTLLTSNSFSEISFKIYPNPVSETLFITSENNSIEKLNVYSINGQFIFSEKENTEQLDVSALSNGLYFVEVTTENSISIRKFIKQ
ncbi:MAG TPA: hypothetical protein DEG69_00220 [Flavobacteriaceae bacterium]|nr:hypothetical protein [Flavobacteriaceae bacterium]